MNEDHSGQPLSPRPLSAVESAEAVTSLDRSTCPPAEELRRWVLGHLSQEHHADFERHILSCPPCQRQLDKIHADEPLLHRVRSHSAGLDGATADVETEAIFSSRLTPSAAHGSVGSTAEFTGDQRFRIVRRLGSGGMGIVYQAYDRQRRETVALKTFRRLTGAAALQLTQEFRVLADIRHPNLVSLYELYAEGDRRFFTMELLAGDDFLTYVRGPDATGSPTRQRGRATANPDEIDRLRPLLPQLAAALEALHAAGKLHRDIKPSNTIVTSGGRLVLVDFGLVTDAQPNEEATGVVAGTAAYMSPEQAAGRVLTPASDWYSVGVMLFEALTGELPFAGRANEVMARKQLEEPLPLDYWGRDLPADLKELCADLLVLNPDRRPTAEELVRRLNCALGVSPAAAKEDGLPSPSPLNLDGLGRPSSCPGGTPAPQLFVGRENELAKLHLAFDAVAAGGSHVVLLRGPSGVGKTALCAEFFRQLAEGDKAVLFRGRCYERELVPYKAGESFMESLVRYLERQPESDVRNWCPPELVDAVHILPILRRLTAVNAVPTESAAMPTDLPDIKRRAFAALRELLRRVTSRAPIAFFIDDLQWGDADSPALFAEWLRGPNPPRLLFVGAYREEAAHGGLWLKTWREAQRKSGFTWSSDELPIGPLPADQAERLARSLWQNLGHVNDAQPVAAKIAERAMGHPLFLRELVEHANVGWDELASPTVEDAGQAGRLHHNNLPSLTEMIANRLAALDADAYRLLQTVAVAGYPITLERAYHAAELPLDSRAPLYTLIDANLARTIADDRLGKLVAYHDSVRETLVSRLSAEALSHTHARLATAAAAEDPVDDEALVLHYQGAGQAELAARRAASAADRAAGNLAFDLAIRCYRLALESPAWTDDERRTVQHKLAHALMHAGHSADAAEEFLQLAQSAAGEDRWRLLYESSLQFLRAGMIDRSLETLAPLFQRLGLRSPRAGDRRALFALLAWRAWLAVTGYRACPRPFRRSGQRILDQIDLCSAVGGPLTFYDVVQGGALITQAMHLALRSGDDARVAIALAQEACMCTLAGNQSRAAKFTPRSETLARRAQNEYALGGVLCVRGIGSILNGEWRHALDHFNVMKEIVERCPGKRFEVIQAEWYSQYALFYGGELRQLAERVSDHLQDAVECRNHFAAAFFRLGIGNLAWLANERPDDARRQIDEARREFHELPTTLRYYSIMSDVRLDLYLGHGAAARRYLRDEWTWFKRSCLLHMPFFGIEAHQLQASCAVAAMRHGITDRTMLRAARRSISYLDRQRAAWPRALASLSRAGLLEARGETPAAIHGYRQSHDLLSKARMPLYAAAALRRLGELTNDEALVSQADIAFLDRGAANPRRFAALLSGA